MVKIVAIEGLDCVGKSTFVAALKQFILSYVKDDCKDKVQVITQHFPVYEYGKGDVIKEVLTSSDSNTITLEDRTKLMDLFIENMKAWVSRVYLNLCMSDFEDTKFRIILCDRFVFSTHLYYLPFTQGQLNEEMQLVLEKQQAGRRPIPPVDKYIFLEGTSSLLNKRLENKLSKHKLFESGSVQQSLQRDYYKILRAYLVSDISMSYLRLSADLADIDEVDKYISIFEGLSEYRKYCLLYSTYKAFDAIRRFEPSVFRSVTYPKQIESLLDTLNKVLILNTEGNICGFKNKEFNNRNSSLDYYEPKLVYHYNK